jgi:hypothetical protein
MGNVKGRYSYDSQKLFLESFGLFGIATLNPIEAYRKDLSWKVDLGLKRRLDDVCDHCLLGQFEVGAGYTFSLARKTVFYLMADLNVESSPSFKGSGWRIGAGPVSGLLWGSPGLRAWIQGSHHWEGVGGLRRRLGADAEVRAKISYQWALGAKFHYEESNERGISDAGLHLYHYF